MLKLNSKLDAYRDTSFFTAVKKEFINSPLAYAGLAGFSAFGAMISKLAFSAFNEAWNQPEPAHSSSNSLIAYRTWVLVGTGTLTFLGTYMFLGGGVGLVKEAQERQRKTHVGLINLTKRIQPKEIEVTNLLSEIELLLEKNEAYGCEKGIELTLNSHKKTVEEAFVKWAERWEKRCIVQGWNWSGDEIDNLCRDLEEKIENAKKDCKKIAKNQEFDKTLPAEKRRNSCSF